MNREALLHLMHAAEALTPNQKILILGSASLLATHPELGDPSAPLAATYDADVLPDPFDELTATMLDEALGEDRAYFRRHGYHVDVLRASISRFGPCQCRR